MGSYCFGVSRDQPTRAEAERRQRVAARHGFDFIETTLPGTGYQCWFEGPNRGAPFDGQAQASICAELDGSSDLPKTPPRKASRAEVAEAIRSDLEREAVARAAIVTLLEASTEPYQPNAEDLAALGRLVAIAKNRSGQSSRCADFLLSWWNAEENGGFALSHLWAVDTAITVDMCRVFVMIARLPVGSYPDGRPSLPNLVADLEDIMAIWRKPKRARKARKGSR